MSLKDEAADTMAPTGLGEYTTEELLLELLAREHEK